MEKGWMKSARSSVEYGDGVRNFIQFAVTNSGENSKILCPCKKCGNRFWLGAEKIYEHLICVGFLPGYTTWVFHGEAAASPEPIAESGSKSDKDDIEQMLLDGFGMYDSSTLGSDDDEQSDDEMDVDVESYYNLVNNGSQELYPGCKNFSKLQFLVRLLKIKNLVDKIQSKSRKKTEHNKTNKFSVPWNKNTEGVIIKRGMEVGLTSPNSAQLVALGTVQNVDKEATCSDGQPLSDYVEVLINIVLKDTTMLPRVHGRVTNMGSTQAHCIPWPRQHVTQSDGSSLQSKVISELPVNFKQNGATCSKDHSQTVVEKTRKKMRVSTASMRKADAKRNFQSTAMEHSQASVMFVV